MKLSAKLDGWINYLESIDASDKLPCIARDYPDGWANLQKRRLHLRWTGKALLIWFLLALASSAYNRFILELPPREFSKFHIIIIIAGCGVLLLDFRARHFYCPRCSEFFVAPNRSGVHYILNRPDSQCMHCGLLIGEKEVNEERRKS